MGVGVEPSSEGFGEGGTDYCGAWLVAFACPSDLVRGDVGDGEVGDFGDPHAEEAKADDDFVPEPDDRVVVAAGDELGVGLLVSEPATGMAGLDLAVGALVGP